MDDVLVYKGNLERSPDKVYFSEKQESGEGGGGGGLQDRWRQRQGGDMDLSQTILFTNDPYITQTEVIYKQSQS